MASSTSYETLPEHFQNIQQAAEFWDKHDLADYWDLTKEVEIDTNIARRVFLVAIESGLADKLASFAHRQGVSTETLVNVWLVEKMVEEATGKQDQ